MADVLQQLRGLADTWEADAPPISIEDVLEHRATANVADEGVLTGAPPLVVVARRADSSRRRSLVMMVTAAAVVAVVAGLVVLAQRPGPAPPGLTTIDSTPQQLPTSTAAATSTVPATSTLPPTSTTPVVVGGTSSELAAVERSVASSLVAFDSFSGTIEAHNETVDSNGTITYSSDSTNRIVMLGGGRIWSEGSPIEWQSFDPNTGIAQMTSHHEDGSTVNLRYRGWASIPMVPAIGLDPLPRFATMAADTAVHVTDLDGVPVWSLTSVRDDPQGGHHEETFVIDRATGLVVRYAGSTVANNSTSRVEATMTDVHLGAELPAQFPGQFPPGADIQDTGGDTFHSLDVTSAASQFGEGFLVSADEQPSRLFVEQGFAQSTDSVAAIVPTTTATIDYSSGFAYATVKLTRSQLPADGGFCHSSDGKTCDSANGPSVVTSGALAGLPSKLANGVLTVQNGTLTVEITAVSDERAVEIADSLTPV